MMNEYELRLDNGDKVIWNGDSGIDACKRYVATFPDAVVIAWRNYPRIGVFAALLPIVEDC